MKKRSLYFALITGLLTTTCLRAAVFTGRIQATALRGGQSISLLYMAGTNWLRIENTATDRPEVVNLQDRQSGALILLFPNNRTFVRVPPPEEPAAVGPAARPLPPGLGQPLIPPASTLPSLPGLPPGMPAMTGSMAALPMPPLDMTLKATGDTTNLLGFTCVRFEIKCASETMEIWATSELMPFQTWQAAQQPRSRPQLIEEQWPELLKSQKMFPLLVTLKFASGPERHCFEAQAITPQTFANADPAWFRPPANYAEVQPLPF